MPTPHPSPVSNPSSTAAGSRRRRCSAPAPAPASAKWLKGCVGQHGAGLLWAALLLLAGTSLSACASSGAAGQRSANHPGEVTYTNAARGSSLSLVSESMLIEMGIPGETPEERTLNFNSETRSSAAVKVCSDEILEGVVELFESEGFGKYASAGVADVADRTSDGVLQVTFNGEPRYLLNSDSSETDPAAKITFARLLNMFAQIYGEVPQYQAIKGQVEFKKPEVSTKLRNEARAKGLLPGSIR